MPEPLTTEQIEATYPDEWVLLSKPQTDPTRILGGVVLFHSKDRDEIHRFAQSVPPPRDLAHFYTGRLPPDAVVIL